MQTILLKKHSKKQSTDKKFNLSDILNFYKGSNNSKIGLEYERLSLDKDTLKNASYEKMAKIIEHFSKIMSWEIIYDKETIIGAKNISGSTLSLEPGCQLEISIKPYENIFDIDIELSKITNLIDKIALQYDVIFVGYGISPKSSESEIALLEKERYKIMYGYLPLAKKAEFCPKMMKQTAGIQVNLDYKDNIDAYYKLKFFNLIMPFMMGLSANSPFEKNRMSPKKSLRAEVWRYTGENRCNIFYKDIFSKIFFKKENISKNYIEELLNVPMVYIRKDDKNIPIKGKITFREYIKQGFRGYFATNEDFMLHQSLCFPDIRFKNYIEIRNHDSQSPAFALGLCAFYKGLSKANFKNLLKTFSYLKITDVEKYSEKIIIEGLNYCPIKGKTGWNIIEKLFKISLENLSAKEKTYLEPIRKIITDKKTQADIIQDYNINDSKDLIEFLK